jgi:hypothetical protein
MRPGCFTDTPFLFAIIPFRLAMGAVVPVIAGE